MKTAISSSFTTTLSFIRMFLGYFQTTLRPFETSGQSNVATLRHLRPRDDLHAPLKGVLEGRGVLAEVRDRRVDGFGVLLGGRLDRVGLGAEERVGRAQVLAPPVPGKPRDVHLDFLDESAVVFHALA